MRKLKKVYGSIKIHLVKWKVEPTQQVTHAKREERKASNVSSMAATTSMIPTPHPPTVTMTAMTAIITVAILILIFLLIVLAFELPQHIEFKCKNEDFLKENDFEFNMNLEYFDGLLDGLSIEPPPHTPCPTYATPNSTINPINSGVELPENLEIEVKDKYYENSLNVHFEHFSKHFGM